MMKFINPGVFVLAALYGRLFISSMIHVFAITLFTAFGLSLILDDILDVILNLVLFVTLFLGTIVSLFGLTSLGTLLSLFLVLVDWFRRVFFGTVCLRLLLLSLVVLFH